MYKIYKLTLHSAIDYAAEELKKYLRMMMLECPEIDIVYDPKATDGFRLGLMQELSLDVSDVEDPALDDILYIDTDAVGGIIAGDNPRSVLLAVYEYLRQNGCRWLFPGVDGEFIPLVEGLQPVKLRHVPTCRFRGQCNEGAEYQQNMLEAIEFTPKVGMNVFMQEFKVPSYYKSFYHHNRNEANRAPEPVTNETIVQWKRMCESEITKRGLQYHDMGHGWTVDAFGIDSSWTLRDGDNDAKIKPEQRQYLALVNGERKLVYNRPTFTQFCMSNPVARKMVVDYTANYAQSHTNVDYLHFWLGDAMNKQCECDNCRKKIPTDWYIQLLNELDAELTARKLDTKVVFIAYTDTIWAPEKEKLQNPDRFSLLFAPISRKYTEALTGDTTGAHTVPYVLNQSTMPKTPEDTFAYFNLWKEQWKGTNLAYEYHFWKHQVFDVAGVRLAPIINEDVRGYKRIGINGIIEDGSQRSFFPTGLNFYVYARTLYDSTLTTEQLIEEYFSCAFGPDWKDFYAYLEKLADGFSQAYLEGEESADMAKSPFYNPSLVSRFETVRSITAEGRKLIEAHYNNPYRIQTVSVRLLEFHALFCELLADALILKCQGKDDEAKTAFLEMEKECGKYEVYFQPIYDQHLYFVSLNAMFNKVTNLEVNQILD